MNTLKLLLKASGKSLTSMKVILFMAVSLNAIIARENNEEDFLSEENWNTFIEIAHKTGCIIWGRKTQEVVNEWEDEYLNDIKSVKKIVVSRNQDFEQGKEFDYVNSPREALEKLEKDGHTEVVLSGGAHLNSAFAKEDLIDEIILNIEPVVIGKGIPLFSPNDFDIKLAFIDFKKLSEKLVQLHYKVVK